MRLSVFARTARDQRRSMVAWAIGLVLLVGMYVGVYPSVKGSGSSFTKLIDQMPKTFRALFTTGGGVDFTTPAGYLNTELLTFMGPMLVLVYAIGAGSALAGEEDRGTLDLLLANPIGRARVLLEKFAALAAGVAVLMTALWLALLVEGSAAGMDVPLAHAAAAVLHLGLLGVEFGALALLVGALTGRLALARAVPAGVAVAAYLVNGFASIVSWLGPIRASSPFYQYIGRDPLRTGLSPTAVLVSVLSIAVLVGLATASFRRRDVLT